MIKSPAMPTRMVRVESEVVPDSRLETEVGEIVGANVGAVGELVGC